MDQKIPIWIKHNLSVEEASVLFRIGETKLRNIINNDKHAKYLLWNGNRVLIKRELFSKYIDELDTI